MPPEEEPELTEGQRRILTYPKFFRALGAQVLAHNVLPVLSLLGLLNAGIRWQLVPIWPWWEIAETIGYTFLCIHGTGAWFRR